MDECIDWIAWPVEVSGLCTIKKRYGDFLRDIRGLSVTHARK